MTDIQSQATPTRTVSVRVVHDQLALGWLIWMLSDRQPANANWSPRRGQKNLEIDPQCDWNSGEQDAKCD